jgi:hypothetical protein
MWVLAIIIVIIAGVLVFFNIPYHITTHIETESKESYDDEGNIREDMVEVTKTILYITITQKTVDESQVQICV